MRTWRRVPRGKRLLTKAIGLLELGSTGMNLVELDVALQARGWNRVNLTSWTLPPRLIARLDTNLADPWQLKTVTEAGAITRAFFPDAESVLAAVSQHGG